MLDLPVRFVHRTYCSRWSRTGVSTALWGRVWPSVPGSRAVRTAGKIGHAAQDWRNSVAAIVHDQLLAAMPTKPGTPGHRLLAGGALQVFRGGR